jgi:predicted metal-binding membrane protein
MSARNASGRLQLVIEIVLGALLVLAWALVIVAIDGALPNAA